MPFKMHKNIFFPEKDNDKIIYVPTLPKIIRPVTRDTLIFFIWPYDFKLMLFQHIAASSGTGEGDLKKLCDIIEAVPDVKYICIDVANGYSEHFVQFVRDVRKKFPEHTIMVRQMSGVSLLHKSVL